MIFGRDDSFPVFEAFAAFFWIVNIPMSCWIEPRKLSEEKTWGQMAIHQNETSPPKMGRLNLPPHPFRFVSFFFICWPYYGY